MNIFKDKGVRIKLRNDEDFLKIKETLTRIGVSSKQENILYQSCHILHKQGEYAILHFKELFELDGKTSNFSDEDRKRRNTIVDLLEDWELLDVIDEDKLDDFVSLGKIKILSHKDKGSWQLVTKYTVGNKK